MTAPDRAKLPIFAIGHRHRLLPLLKTLPGTEGDQLPKAVNIEVIVSVKVAPQPIVPDVSPLTPRSRLPRRRAPSLALPSHRHRARRSRSNRFWDSTEEIASGEDETREAVVSR